jgi:type IV pilus assembly protein PilC
VIVVFIAVMVLMLVVVIPQLSVILKESGQELPIYTKIVVGVSDILVHYGIFILILIIVGGVLAWRYVMTKTGRYSLDSFRLSIPYVGDLYKKLYLSRISDNIDTMLGSGIPMIKSLEITADIVDNEVYQRVLTESAEAIKGGSSVADAFAKHEEMPGIIVQMTRIGEETGKLGFVLKTIARFYKREVDGAVDTLVGLIEPFMIVFLGLGVGIMLASVLLPIYNISTAI